MFLKKIFGTSSTRYIKKIFPIVQNINDFYGGLDSKSDQDLVDRTLELKTLVNQAREDAKVKLCLKDIEKKSSFMKFLGSYPKN